MKLFRVFITGMLISFGGSLPLGTLNVAAMQISANDGIRPALYFSLGSLMVEVIYVRISLVAMDWVRRRKRLFHWLEWLTILIIVALAVSSFIAAAHNTPAKSILLSNTIPRFWLGTMMSAVNPVQIPFWFGASTALFSRKILIPNNHSYNVYIIGIGLGTFFGNLVFILGGRFIVQYLNTRQNLINLLVGCIFAITALILLMKILFRKKDPLEAVDS